LSKLHSNQGEASRSGLAIGKKFIDRIVDDVGRLELPPARGPPVVIFRKVPLKYNLSPRSRRNLRRHLRGYGDLAVRREFGSD
jgi:hypothetical protein